MTKSFYYNISCVDSTAELIDEMCDQEIEVTWRTFLSHVSLEDVKDLFPYYSYNGEVYNPVTEELTCGFHLKDDWAVGFYRSKYDGQRCYFISHSAIEYVFTEHDPYNPPSFPQKQLKWQK